MATRRVHAPKLRVQVSCPLQSHLRTFGSASDCKSDIGDDMGVRVPQMALWRFRIMVLQYPAKVSTEKLCKFDSYNLRNKFSIDADG